MTKFTEEKLELAFIELLTKEGYAYEVGRDISRDVGEVLLKDDLRDFLALRYEKENITDTEILQIIQKFKR